MDVFLLLLWRKLESHKNQNAATLPPEHWSVFVFSPMYGIKVFGRISQSLYHLVRNLKFTAT